MTFSCFFINGYTLISHSAWLKTSFWNLKNQALFSGNKCVPVRPFWILLWSLLIFRAMASSVLSASTFDAPLLKHLRNCISCFKSPKEPSAWILRFVRNSIPSSERIRSRSFSLCFKKVFATWSVFVLSSRGVLQWFPLMQPLLYGQPLQSSHL